MTTSNEQAQTPDVDRLARSMLLLTGHDDDDDHGRSEASPSTGNWSKAPDFGSDPQRAAAVHEATARDKER